jgi:predicted YcjX-like family ATPase
MPLNAYLERVVKATQQAAAALLGEAQREVRAAGRYIVQRKIRLGVTGLSRAGKTVFVTSLIQNMRLAKSDKTRLPFLGLAASDQLINVRVAKIPGVTPFPLRRSIAAVLARHWPEPTRALSGLRLVIDYRPGRWVMQKLADRVRLIIEIIDYPGEWLLDIALATQSYAAWCAKQIALARTPERAALAQDFLAAVAAVRPDQAFDPELHARCHRAFVAYLRDCRTKAALSDVQPGRFLVPDGDAELAGRHEFVPLSDLPAGHPPAGSWAEEMQRRYDSYVAVFVIPFHRRYFLKFDRQVVLVDLLSAIQGGRAVFEDMQRALKDVIANLRYGREWPAALFLPRIGSVVVAASKADHVTDDQYPALKEALQDTVADLRRRAAHAGTAIHFHALAAIKSTRNCWLTPRGGGRSDPGLVGRRLGSTANLPHRPGVVPRAIARSGAQAADWSLVGWDFQQFDLPEPDGAWFPHIGLCEILEDLIRKVTQ